MEILILALILYTGLKIRTDIITVGRSTREQSEGLLQHYPASRYTMLMLRNWHRPWIICRH